MSERGHLLMKVLIEIEVRHAHTPADDWEPWVVEVEGASRKKVTTSLQKVVDFFTEHCIGEAWTTGSARVLTTKESRGRTIENRLVLTDRGIEEK